MMQQIITLQIVIMIYYVTNHKNPMLHSNCLWNYIRRIHYFIQSVILFYRAEFIALWGREKK